MPTESDTSLAREALELADKATPGPWSTKKPSVGPEIGDAMFLPGVMVAAVARGRGIYASPPGGSFPVADQAFIARARWSLPALARALLASTAEVARLRALLRDLEWIVENGVRAPDGKRIGECPECGGYQHVGHMKDCRLAAALKQKP